MKTVLATTSASLVFTPGGPGTGTINFSNVFTATPFSINRLMAIVNQTRNTIIFAEGQEGLGWSNWNQNTSILTLAVDTSTHASSDSLQVIYDTPSMPIVPAEEYYDPVNKQRVSTPQSLIDTDFEYGIQGTKWESVGLINNRGTAFYDPSLTLGTSNSTPNIPGITLMTGTARTVSVTTAAAHNLAAGDPIFVQDSTDPNANGWAYVETVPSGTTFTYLAKDRLLVGGGASILDTNRTLIYQGQFYTGAGIPVPANAFSSNQGGSLRTLITCTTVNAHGLVAGDLIYIRNTGANATVASNNLNGAWVVVSTPSANTFTFNVNTAPANMAAMGNLAGTNVVYPRFGGNAIHRPYDGGTQISCGTGTPNAQVIRQTRKYFRYQSGKGIQFSTGSVLRPAFNLNSLAYSAVTNGLGGTARVTVTTKLPHGMQVGSLIVVSGTNDSGYNGTYEVDQVIDDLTFTYQPFLRTDQIVNQSITIPSTFPTTISITAHPNQTYVANQPITLQANQTNFINGTITSYNPVNGALSLSVATGGTTGSGTFTRWTVGVKPTIISSTNLTSATVNSTITVTINTGLSNVLSGLTVTIASVANIANNITGTVVSYNNVTGALVVLVTAVNGTINTNSWFVTLYNTAVGTPTSPIVITPGISYNITTRLGLYDHQNGMFFEYDGQFLYAVRRNSTFQLTGLATLINGLTTATANSNVIVGTNTQFSTQLVPGDFIVVKGITYRVLSISSDTLITVSPEFRAAVGNSMASTTSITVGTGTIAITLPVSRTDVIVGANVLIAATNVPNVYMAGVVASYTSGTGAATITVPTTTGFTGGAGTYSSWTVWVGGVYVIGNAIMSKVVETRFRQDQWNLDRMDGSGPSGYVLDPSKMQMFYIDYTWYGAGFVRWGLRARNGNVFYFHKLLNNNTNTEAHMRSGNLPARYEENTFLTVTTLSGSNSYVSGSTSSIRVNGDISLYPDRGYLKLSQPGNTSNGQTFVSNTSLTLATNTTLTPTIAINQTGIGANLPVILSNSASQGNYVIGRTGTYNSGTGALQVNVPNVAGFLVGSATSVTTWTVNIIGFVSSTSLTIGTGVMTLTIGSNLTVTPGQQVTIVDTTTNTNWMAGTVIRYTSNGNLTVNITSSNGSGTNASWFVNVAPLTEYIEYIGKDNSTRSLGTTQMTRSQLGNHIFSGSAITPGTGNQTFNVPLGLLFVPGQQVTIVSPNLGITSGSMVGTVTSYTQSITVPYTADLVVNVSNNTLPGTAASTWFIIPSQTFTPLTTAPVSVESVGMEPTSFNLTPLSAVAPAGLQIQHWGSSVMMDGRFDDDVNFVFNTGNPTVYNSSFGAGASVCLMMIRLAPSVDSGRTGGLGVREIINRMQLRLRSMDIMGNSTTSQYRFQIFLNVRISGGTIPVWQNVGGSSLAQVCYPTSATLDLTRGENVFGFFVYGTSSTQDLSQVRELSNSVLGGGYLQQPSSTAQDTYPDGPDTLAVIVTNVGGIVSSPGLTTRLSWTEAQA